MTYEELCDAVLPVWHFSEVRTMWCLFLGTFFLYERGRNFASHFSILASFLQHWHNLRKHNGERYAYSSHSQAVLDCLRNRNEWAHLVDRGPKVYMAYYCRYYFFGAYWNFVYLTFQLYQTNASRKRRKLDAEPLSFELEDSGYCGRRRTSKEVEGGNNNTLESHGEEFPKGKRKARKRRRLALQGRRVKDVRKRIEDDDDDDDDDDNDDDDENGPGRGGGGNGDGINPLSSSSEEMTFSDEEEAYGGGEASASSDELQT